MSSTLPYFSSHSPLTSSASSRSQSRSVSSSGLKAFFIKLERWRWGWSERARRGDGEDREDEGNVEANGEEARRKANSHIASHVLRDVRAEPAREKRSARYSRKREEVETHIGAFESSAGRSVRASFCMSSIRALLSSLPAVHRFVSTYSRRKKRRKTARERRTRLLPLQLRLLSRLKVLVEGCTAVSNESNLDLRIERGGVGQRWREMKR
jgi:hypothetical protein